MAEKYIPRLQKLYKDEIVSSLMKELNLSNIMQVPKLDKIVVNMGIGEAASNPKLIDAAIVELAQITGQQPVARAARKSEAGFKLREGQKIGAKVTLRKEKMYEFLDRLISITLPRVRDFEGVSPKGFDGRGNYTLGLREQIVFPEIEIDKVDKIFGLGITIVAAKRAELKARAKKGDREAILELSKLPRNASPTRVRNRCQINGRPRGYMREFGISRVMFRQLAGEGVIPGVKKSSW